MVERITGSSVAIRQVAKSQPPSRRASLMVSSPRRVFAAFLAGALAAGAFAAGAGAFLTGALTGAFTVAFFAAAFLAGAFFCGLSATGPPQGSGVNHPVIHNRRLIPESGFAGPLVSHEEWR